MRTRTELRSQGHRRLKDVIAQELILRGSADFESVEQYAKFVRRIVDRRNRLVREKLAGEYPHLRGSASGTSARVRKLQRQSAQSGAPSGWTAGRIRCRHG